MRGFFIFLFFVLCFCSVDATPLIISLSSNDLENNQNYTISGSEFGIKNNVAPLNWEDFESDWIANDLLNSKHNWSWRIGVEPESYWPRCVVDLSRLGSTKSARFINKRDTATGWISTRQTLYKQDDSIGYTRNMYFSFWVKPVINDTWVAFNETTDPQHRELWHAQQLKLFHISRGDSFDNPCYTPNIGNIRGGYSGIYSFMRDDVSGVPNTYPITSLAPSYSFPAYNNATCPVSPNCEGYPFANGSVYLADNDNRLWPLNTWHHVETQLDPGAVGEEYTGSIKIWIDGMDVSDPAWRQNFVRYYRNEGCYKFNEFSIGSYLANSYSGYGEVYYDNVYFDTSWQRIIICNSSTWNDNTSRHCEIQIPHTTWNDDAIQFQANRGSFGNEQLYLYVIDAEGVVSGGYPVSFGTSIEPFCGDLSCNNGETCSTCETDCGACSSTLTQTIDLVQGWNLVTLKVNATISSNALQSLFVMRYENNQWQTAWGSSSGSAFNLEPLRGYYVYSTNPKTITVTGTALNPDYNYALQDYDWNLFAVNRTATFNSIYPDFVSIQEELYRVDSGFSYTARNVNTDNLAAGEFYWVNIRSPQESPVYTIQVKTNDLFGGIITYIYNIFS